MPHFTLEYSDNLRHLDARACLRAVNAALVRTGQFDEVDIKSRARSVAVFEVGVPAAAAPEDTARGIDAASHAGRPERAFAAGQLAVLTGRPPEVRQALTRCVLNALEAAIAPHPGLHLQVTVELVEIDRASYVKAVRP